MRNSGEKKAPYKSCNEDMPLRQEPQLRVQHGGRCRNWGLELRTPQRCSHLSVRY